MCLLFFASLLFCWSRPCVSASISDYPPNYPGLSCPAPHHVTSPAIVENPFMPYLCCCCAVAVLCCCCCCAVLCCAVLCCAVLCCVAAVLCCAVSCCCCAVLSCLSIGRSFCRSLSGWRFVLAEMGHKRRVHGGVRQLQAVGTRHVRQGGRACPR